MAIPDFRSHLNNNSLSLKFTTDFDSESITFLDLQLRGNPVKKSIDTITYRKEVAWNTILSAKSCHPLHTLSVRPELVGLIN